MNSGSLIKWKFVWIKIVFMIIGSIAIIAIEKLLFGSLYSLWVLGGLLMIWGVVYYLKIRIYQILILSVVAGLGLCHAFLVFQIDTRFTLYGLIIHAVVFLVLLPLFIPILLKSYELERNAKRLFKLASEFGKDKPDGYHDRPFLAGQIEYKNEEIIGFARYLYGKRIAKTEIRSDMVVISFSMKTSPLSNPNLNDISYMTFDFIGVAMVYISRRDYKKYKDSQSFDHLCESMGKLFKRFLDYYQNGNEERFIAVLKSV